MLNIVVDGPFEPLGNGWALLRQFNVTSEEGLYTGSERSRIASMKLKIAVLAPIPRASERTARPVKVLLRSMFRPA